MHGVLSLSFFLPAENLFSQFLLGQFGSKQGLNSCWSCFPLSCMRVLVLLLLLLHHYHCHYSREDTTFKNTENK